MAPLTHRSGLWQEAIIQDKASEERGVGSGTAPELPTASREQGGFLCSSLQAASPWLWTGVSEKTRDEDTG